MFDHCPFGFAGVFRLGDADALRWRGDALARTQDPQERLVKGTVTSNDGEPLAGAFVYVKNSKLGVNTDLDGHYEIAAPVEGKSYVLVFHFLV